MNGEACLLRSGIRWRFTVKGRARLAPRLPDYVDDVLSAL
jgi:hypothetical protein